MSEILTASEMKKAIEGEPINELTELQAKFFLMKALVITSGINFTTSLRSDICETISSNVEFRIALKEQSERLKRRIEDGKA